MARSLAWACVSMYLVYSTIVPTIAAAEEIDGEIKSDPSGLAGPQHEVHRGSLDEAHSESAIHKRWTSGSRATEAEILKLLSTIEDQLEPFNDGITLEMVERLYCNALEYPGQQTVRFQVIDGRPYVAGPMRTYQPRAQTMMAQIMNLATKFRLPDLDFMMSMNDMCPDLDDFRLMQLRSKQADASNCTKNAPLFVFGKTDSQKQCVTVPDWSFENWPEADTPNWSTVRAWMLYAAEQRPFSKRQPTTFWRGGMTHWVREQLIENDVLRTSELFDVVAVNWRDSVQRAENWVSLAKHCDYQHLLHLRGNGYSNRLKSLMLCGSPVIFPYGHAFEEKEFWYHMLIDRHNIMLPTSDSVENLRGEIVAAAEELGNNKRLSQEVAMFGQHLAAEILHPDNIDKYWIALFEQYSKLQLFKPKLHVDASPLEEGLLRPYKFISSKERTCEVC